MSLICALPSAEHTIWIERHALAFVYIPKVACTSWKLFFYQYLYGGLPAGLAYSQVHDAEKLPLPYVSILNSTQYATYQHAVANHGATFFSVIRDPIQRVLSAFLDKILYHTNTRSFFSECVIPEIFAHHSLSNVKKPTFLQFLQWLTESESSHVDNDHWRPMTRILAGFPESTKCELWPMTKMHLAVDAVNQHLGSSIVFPSRESLGPRTSTRSDQLISHFFCSDSRRLFESYYRSDLELYHRVLDSRRSC